MNAPALVDRLRTRGARLSASGDRLVIDAPPGVVTPDDLAALREHKAEVLPLLESAPSSPAWSALSAARWGSATPDPPIDLDADAWRWTVANWSHTRWSAWRRLAGELAPPGATADRIRSAEHAAFLELTDGGR